MKRASSAGVREMARMELAAAEGTGEGKEEEDDGVAIGGEAARSRPTYSSQMESKPWSAGTGSSKAEQRRAARAAHFDRLFARQGDVPVLAAADIPATSRAMSQSSGLLAGASAALAGLPSLSSRPESPLGPPAAGRARQSNDGGGTAGGKPAVISPLTSAHGPSRVLQPQADLRPESGSAAERRQRHVTSARSAASAGASSPLGAFGSGAGSGGSSPSAMMLRGADAAAESSRAAAVRRRQGNVLVRGRVPAREQGGEAVSGPPLVPRRAFADLEADFHAAVGSRDSVSGSGASRKKPSSRSGQAARSPTGNDTDAGGVFLGIGGVGLQGSDAEGGSKGGWVGAGDSVDEMRRHEEQKERRAEERLRAR